MRQRSNPLPVILLTILAGLLLSVLPLPSSLQVWRPEWLKLVVIFWVIYAPGYMGYLLAFALGIMLDMILATPLGMNASAFVLIVYLASLIHRWAGIFSMRQISVLVLFLLVAARCINHIELILLDDAPADWRFYFPALSSALVWPTVMFSLRRWTYR